MIFFVAAVLLLALTVGPAAQLPLPATLVAGAVILAWLTVFALRERSHRHERS